MDDQGGDSLSSNGNTKLLVAIEESPLATVTNATLNLLASSEKAQ